MQIRRTAQPVSFLCNCDRIYDNPFQALLTERLLVPFWLVWLLFIVSRLFFFKPRVSSFSTGIRFQGSTSIDIRLICLISCLSTIIRAGHGDPVRLGRTRNNSLLLCCCLFPLRRSLQFLPFLLPLLLLLRSIFVFLFFFRFR